MDRTDRTDKFEKTEKEKAADIADRAETGAERGAMRGVGGLGALLRRELSKRRASRFAIVLDCAVFLIALLFARRHIAFGVYPLGIALVGTASSRVLIAAVGALVGAISLGEIGLIYAILIPLTLLLRFLLSGGVGVLGEGGELFSEQYVIRIAAVAVSSAIGGLYEVLSRAFSLSSLLFAAFGVLLSVGIAFSFFGVFTSSVTLRDILAASPFSGERGRTPELVLYRISALILIFFISLAASEVDVLGISLSLLVLAAFTLFVARRFGAVSGMAVGFMGGLAIGSTQAVGFALAGLAAGALFGVGGGYALVGAGVALGVWCGFAGGLVGFLSSFPEYGIGALLIMPYLGRTHRAHSEPEDSRERPRVGAAISVAAMKKTLSESELLEESFLRAARAVRSFLGGEGALDFYEYRNIIIALTSTLDPIPCEENVDALASRFYKRSRVTEDDVARILGEECRHIYKPLVRLVADYERECLIGSRCESVVGEYERLADILSSEREMRSRQLLTDSDMTARLSEAFDGCGFVGGEIRALGDRRRLIVAAVGSEQGERLADSELHRTLERSVGLPLDSYEYYKCADTAVMLCECAESYSVECGFYSVPSSRTGVSGDTVSVFCRGGRQYALIADGVGSGERPREISSFVGEYLGATLSPSCRSPRQSLAALSSLLRSGREECASTLDLFSFDLYTGEASFVKCGGVSSYIKRGSSVFTVRSGGAPLGLSRAPDVDEVRAEVRVGDMIVMLSDGIAPLPDEACWLIEHLAAHTDKSPEEYARELCELSRTHTGDGDDRCALVIKIISPDGIKGS